MIKKMFAVYDLKTKFYIHPFFCYTLEEALRIFQTAANDESTKLHEHPSDYRLDQIGNFDTTSGEIVSDLVLHGFAIQYLLPKASPQNEDAQPE